MKVVILAGGLGTRIASPGVAVPKPLVEIDNRPIISHIMEGFSRQGFNEFVIALGFKGDQVKDYFLRHLRMRSDLQLNFASGAVRQEKEAKCDWRVSLVDTGEMTMTGGRLKRLASHLDGTFFLTYGDGLSNVDLRSLLSHHEKTGAMLTITAVNPTSRYGEVVIDSQGGVTQFKEKPEFTDDWVNGGFMVLEPEVLDLVEGDKTILESDVMSRVAASGKMSAFRHRGFWHCMDTLRDRAALEKLAASGNYPWLNLSS